MSPVRSVTYVSGPDQKEVVRPGGLELSTFWFVDRIIFFAKPGGNPTLTLGFWTLAV